MRTIAIDPGTQLVGWSLWEGKALVSAGFAMTDAKTLAERVKCLCEQMGRMIDIPTDRLVCETMIHSLGRSGSIAGDLLDVQTVVGAMLGLWSSAELELVRATDWKGTAPKSLTSARILKALESREITARSIGLVNLPRSLHHNVDDAIGLGGYSVGRWRKGVT